MSLQFLFYVRSMCLPLLPKNAICFYTVIASGSAAAEKQSMNCAISIPFGLPRAKALAMTVSINVYFVNYSNASILFGLKKEMGLSAPPLKH